MTHKVNDQTFNDYYKFLTTTEGADILPYAYLGAGDSYEQLIKNCKDYYLFDDEVALIKNNHRKLKHYLSGISNIIEIGPGSKHTVINKTIPILQYAENLQSYLPIDLCQSYLTDACDIVKKNIPGLHIMPIEHNIMQPKPLSINNIKGRRAIIFLGGTPGNFNTQQQNNIMAQLYDLLEPDDLLFITFDTNLDNDSLLKAYNNQYNDKFIKGTLTHLAKINPDFLPHINKFISKCIVKENEIEMFLIATETFTFSLPNYGNILIKQGQEARSIKSRKFSTNQIVSLLEKNNFTIVDILNDSNKIKMFIGKINRL